MMMEEEISIEQEEETPEPYDIAEVYWLRKPYNNEEYANVILDKAKDTAALWTTSQLGSAIWKAYRTYHSMDGEGSLPTVDLTTAGDDGELISLKVNQYRNIVHHQLALAAGQRPAWDPQARTSDSAAAKQVSLARSILDFVMSAKKFERKLYDQAESSFVLGSAYFVIGWDVNAGPNGQGDVFGRILMPWELVFERTRDYDDVKWWIFKLSESRWDWVEHFAVDDPEKAEKIATMTVQSQVEDQNVNSEYGDDRIPVWILYALPSKSLPNGRYSKVTDGGIVLFDGPYPFGDARCVVRMAPNEFLGTSQPYADSWSLLPVTDAYSDTISTIMTRIDGFGIPNITKPQGSELEVEDMSGMRMIDHPAGTEKPSVLDLLKIPPELIQVLGVLQSVGEMLGGINSVSRGNPAENITSGSMAALVQSMAIQYNSALERAVTCAAEDVGTAVLKVYQCMADMPQLISICGQDNAWTAAEFTKESIKDIQRVSVKTVNPMSKTTAGRSDIADKLLERGAINSPQEYLNILATGNVDPFFSGPVNQLSAIKSENERMMKGEPAHVVVYENHELHIREHMADIDAQMRENMPQLKMLSDHIMEHFMMWQKLSRETPDLLTAMGQKILPAAQAVGQQAAMMHGQAPGPEGPTPNPGEEPNTQKAVGKAGRPPSKGDGKEPGALPSMPKPAENPMTGQAPV